MLCGRYKDVKLKTVQVSYGYCETSDITFMNEGLCLASGCSWKYIVGLSELEHMSKFLIIKRLIN